jgi:hypothetical protein
VIIDDDIITLQKDNEVLEETLSNIQEEVDVLRQKIEQRKLVSGNGVITIVNTTSNVQIK